MVIDICVYDTLTDTETHLLCHAETKVIT